MTCPRCQHPHFVKNGHIDDRQRYKCKDCEYQWIENPKYRGRPLAEKALAVFLYCHGLSMNAIAKMLQASPSTILEWIRNFAGEHATLPDPPQNAAVVLELDEMWHYLKKKRTNSGYGKLCVVIPESSSPGRVVIGIKRPLKSSSDA